MILPPDLEPVLPEHATSEQGWMAALHLTLPRVLRVRVFRQIPGKKPVQARPRSAEVSWMRGAPVGAADLTGWCRGTGRRLEIECKYGNGRTTAEQARWIATASEEGVVALVARYEPGASLRANLARIVDALRQLIAGGAS